GMIDGQLVVNPLLPQLEESQLNMVVAGTADAIMMVEGEADQIPEETLVDAIELAHEEIRRIVAMQLELAAQAGKEKWEFNPPEENAELLEAVASWLGDSLRNAVHNPDKVLRLEGTNELRTQTIAHFATPEIGS